MRLNINLIKSLTFTLTLCVSLAFTACGADDDSDTMNEGGSPAAGEMMGDAELAIVGSYTDGFSTHEVSTERWTITYEGTPSIFHIDRFDNELGYLVAQNDAENEFSPELWCRFDWLINGEELWYCQIIFDAESAEDAENNAADPSDPSMGGCGDFPWTLLNPAE